MSDRERDEARLRLAVEARHVTLLCTACRRQSRGPLVDAGRPCDRGDGGALEAFVSPRPDAPGCWVTGEDVRRVMHALGVHGIDKRRWGYRNHYAPGERDAESMRRLVDAGLMVPGAPYYEARFHHATPLAGQLLGFGRVLMKRGWGDD